MHQTDTRIMYQANDLLTLKRHALVCGDLATLREISKYERNLRVYYKRRGEDVIRNREGKPVELEESLPEILAVLQEPADNQAPGELIRKVREGKSELVIIELAPNAVFPVSGAALSACRATPAPDLDRIAGVVFYRACPGLYFLRCDDLTIEQMANYLQIPEYQFNF